MCYAFLFIFIKMLNSIPNALISNSFNKNPTFK